VTFPQKSSIIVRPWRFWREDSTASSVFARRGLSRMGMRHDFIFDA